MKKDFLKFLETKNISEDDYKAKSDAEKAELHTEFFNNQFKELKKSIEAKPDAKKLEDAEKELKTLQEGMKDYVKSEDLGNIKKELKEAQETIDQLKEGGGASSFNPFAEINKFIKDNISKIQKIHSEGSGMVEITVKAPENITTGNGTNTAPPNLTGTQQAPLSNVNLRGTFVASLTSNFNTNLAAYPYTEAKPKDGDYSFVAEGTAKPQTDFTWETNYAKPVKVAAWIRLTDESIQDVANLQSVANDYLRKKHDLKKQHGILFGDGVAPNPKGATTYGRNFVAGAMANKVVNPNIMDVINACITDVFNTHNYEDEMAYLPSLVVLNPTDFFLHFTSKKDGDGKPLYPTASLFNVVNIGGLTIMPERSVPAGKIFVSDMSKYNTTNYKGYTVKIGYVNDDFIKNQFVILGESRFHAFVKKLDEQAFIYDDIATVEAAITKP